MKKRLLCSLLVFTMAFSQALSAGATTVSDNAVEISAEAENETEATGSPEMEAQQAEEETADPEAETAGNESIIPSVTNQRVEIGSDFILEATITPNTKYTARLVKKDNTKEYVWLESGQSQKSDKDSLKLEMKIPKDRFEGMDYELQIWVGDVSDYEDAANGNRVYRKDIFARKSINAALNQQMSALKVENAVYTGSAVVPNVILKETKEGVEYTLKQGVDFKVDVVSANTKEMGKAEAKITGIGNYAGELTAEFDIVPQAPAITGVTCLNTSSVKITWNKSPNAQGYSIDRKAVDGAFVNVGQTDGKTTAFTDTTPGLEVGQTYYYRVQARATSAADASKEVESIPNEIGVAVKILPAAPEIVSLENESTTKLKLTWKQSEEADGYRIYKVENGKLKKIKEIATAETTSYTIKKLSCGYTYTYCVKAFKKNAEGTKVYSKESKRISGKAAPATPQLVSVTSVKATVNEIKWKKVSGATGYRVYRKESGSSKWKRIATIAKGSAESYQDEKAKTGKKYAYTVKAYTKAKVNGKTKTIYGKFDTKGISGKAVPAKTVFTMQQNTRGVLITIANSEGASGYYLYRKKGDEKWNKRDVPSQGGDFTVYLDKDITAATSYQYYIVPYTQTETSRVKGVKSDTQKFATK